MTRRNYAVAVQDRTSGLVYALCCSTTTDAFDDQKAAMFTAMVGGDVVRADELDSFDPWILKGARLQIVKGLN